MTKQLPTGTIYSWIRSHKMFNDHNTRQSFDAIPVPNMHAIIFQLHFSNICDKFCHRLTTSHKCPSDSCLQYLKALSPPCTAHVQSLLGYLLHLVPHFEWIKINTFANQRTETPSFQPYFSSNYMAFFIAPGIQLQVSVDHNFLPTIFSTGSLFPSQL